MTYDDQHLQGQDALYTGDDRTLSITVEDDSKSAIDITGATITWALADRYTDHVYVTKDNDGTGGLSITDAANGVFEVTIDPSDTENLDPDRDYVHEVQLEDSAGTTDTILRGNVELRGDRV